MASKLRKISVTPKKVLGWAKVIFWILERVKTLYF